MKKNGIFTYVADVAKKLGYEPKALQLLNYLDNYHPDLALDWDFISGRMDDYQKTLERYADEPIGRDDAAHQVLMAGLEYSEHDILETVFAEVWADRHDGKAPNKPHAYCYAKTMRPLFKPVFEKYPDREFDDFSDTEEYDEMLNDLSQAIDEHLENHGDDPDVLEKLKNERDRWLKDQELIAESPLADWRNREDMRFGRELRYHPERGILLVEPEKNEDLPF